MTVALNPRHEKILVLLQNLRQVSVADLTDRLGVSQVTIRKDLTELEEKGYLLRQHGGARLAQNIGAMAPVSARRDQQGPAKARIANRAAELVQDGDSVFIDAGSTNLMLAETIRDRSIRVVTNGLDILNALADSDTVTLTAVGGNFRQEAGSFIGPLAVEAVRLMRFDIAFVGATGFTARGEFLTQNSIEGSVKRAVLEASHRRVILADSSKFEARAFAIFASADEVDLLVTDKGFDREIEFRTRGIEVIFAKEEI